MPRAAPLHPMHVPSNARPAVRAKRPPASAGLATADHGSALRRVLGGPTAALRPSDLLALQRSVGNHAVGQLLVARDRPPSAVPANAGGDGPRPTVPTVPVEGVPTGPRAVVAPTLAVGQVPTAVIQRGRKKHKKKDEFGSKKSNPHKTQYQKFVTKNLKKKTTPQKDYDDALEKAKALDKVYTASLTSAKYPKAPNLAMTDERVEEEKQLVKLVKSNKRKLDTTKFPPGKYHKAYHGKPSVEGSGTWMKARLTTDLPLGSDTSGSRNAIPWDKDHLANRKESAGGKTLYVLGHLLNNNIGGTATAPNLVPLTAAEAGTTGANDANKAHVSLVEGIVKGLVARMKNGQPGDPQQVTYEIAAVKRTAKRPQTQKMKDLADEFEKTYQDEFVANSDEDARAGAVLKKAAETKADEGQLAAALRAVGLTTSRADTASGAMAENAALWKYEDEHVPDELVCQVGYTQYGQPVGPITRHVPVQLPTHLDAPYKKG